MDENKFDGNGELKKEMERKHIIHIEMDVEGNVSVSSNILNLVLGNGLCEVAKDFIKADVIRRENQSSKIIPGKGGIMNFVRNKQERRRG